MCGGTDDCINRRLRAWGLSPRVRGNPSRPAPGARHRWSIPACAGEPPCTGERHEYTGVYPRVCGGTSAEHEQGRPHGGLSPRVRGNRLGVGQHDGRTGSIPACAGEPRSCISSMPFTRVYPRVCGGTPPHASARHGQDGLSPRVRGNRLCPAGRRGGGRSIPACAGEPCEGAPRQNPVRVYPRVCGGTRLIETANAGRYGLSPRVRGNRVDTRRT